jgi:eukaryotic-like serine/threonine-protein kinase
VTTTTEPLFAGRYELGKLLGGGTADVYLGTDTRLRRPVVVKIARTGPADLDADRFENEMRLLAKLDDPGLVTLYDAGTVDNRPYLVMQYVSGGTLSDKIRPGALEPDEVSRIGSALADALGYLHEHQVIHRDLKPGNVLFDSEGKAHLADFGIARTVDAARVTATGLVIGTPAYLSPEQARGEEVTPASDLYALGLVLLECLTGRREYVGAPLEVAIARLHRPPSVPQDLPAPWPGLLAGLFADDPAVRPGARQVADVLAGRATTPLPVVQEPIGRTSAGYAWASTAAADGNEPAAVQSHPAPYRRRRRGVLAGLAAAGLTAVAASAVLLASAWQPDPASPSQDGITRSSVPAKPTPKKSGQPAAPAANQQDRGNSGGGSGSQGSGQPGAGAGSGAGQGGNSGGNSGGAGSGTNPGTGPSTPPATSAPGGDPTTDPPVSSDPPTDPPTSDSPPPAAEPTDTANPAGDPGSTGEPPVNA